MSKSNGDKGLTEIKEYIRGFVGRRGLLFDNTQDGRSRMRFDLAAGKNDTEKNKFATWRHCIAYDKDAEYLKDLKPGDYLKISGWITTEAVRDSFMKPIVKDGQFVTREYLICQDVKMLGYENSQRQLPLVVGQATS